MKQTSKLMTAGAAAVTLDILGGRVAESLQTLPVAKMESASRPHAGVRASITVGEFDDRSACMRGVFSGDVDRLNGQAKTILITHLQQVNRFSVLDRDNMTEIKQGAAIRNTVQKFKGVNYIITGDVIEFGREEAGGQQLFGVFGCGKEQVTYAKVTLNVVSISTSGVVYSMGGADEYRLSNHEVVDFGGTANCDSTLNGKMLDLAMYEAVDNLVDDIESGAWKLGAQ